MKAVLDANLFFSMWITDPLLSFAEADFYDPVWSRRIMAEVEEHLPKVWAGATPNTVARYLMMIQAAFPEAEVEGWQWHEQAVKLPDTDDRHVVAAAIEAHADVIVTMNVKDFPDAALSPYGIRAMSPDRFLTMLFNEDPEESLRLMRALVDSKNRPPRTMDEEIYHLERLGLHEFAALLKGKEA